MQPQHTLVWFDCGPACAAMRRAISQCSDGTISESEAVHRVQVVASTIPGLTVEKFVRFIETMLARQAYGRALEAVDRLSGLVLRPWVLTLMNVIIWGLLLGLVVVVLWLVFR